MRIAELLAEGYPDTIAAFSQEADANQVKKTVDQYRDLVNRNQVSGTERNIDWWRRQGWPAFKQFVDDKSTQATKTQVKRKRAAGKSIMLKDTPEWLVVIPLDHDASCFHGRGSDWCTARPSAHYFDSYFLDKDVVLIYCINKTTGNKYAIASHRDHDETELFDMKDNTISAAEFQQATGFDPESLIKLIPHDDPRIAQVKQSRRELLAKIQQLMVIWKRSDCTRNAEIEQLLSQSKHPELCSRYVVSVGEIHGPQPFPPIIAMAAVKQGSRAIQYIANPSEAVQLAAVKQDGWAIQYIKNPSEAVQQAAIKKYGRAIQYIKNPSEAVQQAAVNQDGRAIQYIANPSEAVQQAAVNQYGPAIQYIANPSEALQLAVVRQDGSAIQYITNPSEAVQLAAVKQDGSAIQYIANPSEALQLAAVKQYGRAIQYITNPSEALQLAVVRQDGRAIYYIKNPSEAVQQAAVKQNGRAIRYIKNPSEALQLAAIKKYGSEIQYIKNPSEALQQAAVNQDGRAIRYIANPSEAVQQAAVNQDGWAIEYIKNPSEALQLAAVNQDGSAIQYIKNPTPNVIKLAAAQGYNRQGNRIT